MTERRERLSRVERRKSIRMTERRERLGEVKRAISRYQGGGGALLSFTKLEMEIHEN